MYMKNRLISGGKCHIIKLHNTLYQNVTSKLGISDMFVNDFIAVQAYLPTH